MKIRLEAPLIWFCRLWTVHVQVNSCENCSLDIVAYITSSYKHVPLQLLQFMKNSYEKRSNESKACGPQATFSSNGRQSKGSYYHIYFCSFFHFCHIAFMEFQIYHRNRVKDKGTFERTKFTSFGASFSIIIYVKFKAFGCHTNFIFNSEWKVSVWSEKFFLMLFMTDNWLVLRSDIWFAFHTINENNIIHCCQHAPLNSVCVDVVAFSIFQPIYQEKHNNIDTISQAKCYGNFPHKHTHSHRNTQHVRIRTHSLHTIHPYIHR